MSWCPGERYGKEGRGLTTPHAPWTPNWMQNAPAARPLKLVGRIQSGINAAWKAVVSVPMYAQPAQKSELTADEADEDAVGKGVSGGRTRYKWERRT